MKMYPKDSEMSRFAYAQIFEWYDFYLYGTLAVFFGSLFFPKGKMLIFLALVLLERATNFLAYVLYISVVT